MQNKSRRATAFRELRPHVSQPYCEAAGGRRSSSAAGHQCHLTATAIPLGRSSRRNAASSGAGNAAGADAGCRFCK